LEMLKTLGRVIEEEQQEEAQQESPESKQT
jgi:hypothetical protein